MKDKEVKFSSAKWIAPGALAPEGTAILSRAFFIDRPIKGAILHASAMGIYYAFINGKRVGESCICKNFNGISVRFGILCNIGNSKHPIAAVFYGDIRMGYADSEY